MTETVVVELRSEEVQELLSAHPSGLVRWGTSAAAFAALMLLLATCIIRYPDILTGRAALTLGRPPVPVVARSSGRIARLYVHDRQEVPEGAVLGVLENPADPDDVLSLVAELRETAASPLASAPPSESSSTAYRRLGELQGPYSAFVKSRRDLVQFRKVDYRSRKSSAIQAQMDYDSAARDGLRRQQELARERVALRRSQYERSRTLFEQGLLAETDLQAAALAYNESRNAAQDADTRVLASRGAATDYRTRLLDLERETTQAELDREAAVKDAYKELLSAVAAWEDRFALRAAVSGVVYFSRFWADNQFVKVNDEVMTVAPGTGVLSGRATLPRAGVGKARPGQRVMVRLDDYPYQEFGALEGRVHALSTISRGDEYAVDLSFPNGLVTTYGRAIPPRPELHGTVEVVTDDARLLWRILRPVRAAVSP
jgi:multidrug resistance efflux pump